MEKWNAIGLAGCVAAFWVAIAVMDYGTSQCRAEGMKSNYTAEQIAKICH